MIYHCCKCDQLKDNDVDLAEVINGKVYCESCALDLECAPLTRKQEQQLELENNYG